MLQPYMRMTDDSRVENSDQLHQLNGDENNEPPRDWSQKPPTPKGDSELSGDQHHSKRNWLTQTTQESLNLKRRRHREGEAGLVFEGL